MKSSIYHPWQIDSGNYPNHAPLEEQIKFMLGYAILAPSTFNSQPWLCQIEHNKVLIYINYQRMPHKSDKQGRFGLVSIGCFLENLLIASQALGWTSNVQINHKISSKDS